MYAQNAYNAYKNNSVNYAPKEQLLLMLLDGAVKYSKMGRMAMIDKNIQEAHNNITRTQDIFIELIVTLDVKQAGEWGLKMKSIYKFIVDELGQANIKKSVDILDKIIPLIEEVRDTWTQTERIARVKK